MILMWAMQCIYWGLIHTMSKLTSSPLRHVVIVIIDDHPQVGILITAAKHYADYNNYELHALYKSIDSYQKHERMERLTKNITQAEHIGETLPVMLDASDMKKSFLEYVSNLEQSECVVERVYAKKPGREIWYRPWVSEEGWLTSADIKDRFKTEFISFRDVDVPRSVTEWLGMYSFTGMMVLKSLLAVLIAFLTVELLDQVAPEIIAFNSRNRPLIYMTACAFSAGRYGLVPGMVAAVASFLALNLSAYAPYYKLSAIDDITDVTNLLIFLVASIMISLFVSRNFMRNQRQSQQISRIHVFNRIYQGLIGNNSTTDAMSRFHEELQTVVDVDVVFFMPKSGPLSEIEVVYPVDYKIDDELWPLVRRCWINGTITGFATTYSSDCPFRFKPLITNNVVIGVIGYKMKPSDFVELIGTQLLRSATDLISLIMERSKLGEKAELNRLQVEQEKLRSMLLSSVSHDLKTPLASVIGSLSVYRTMGENLSTVHRQTLISTALDEAMRLDSFITNILDMTRLESGQVKMKPQWVKPFEMAKEVKRRFRDRLRDHILTISFEVDDAEVFVDRMMTEQVFQNLVDNAVKYTPAGTEIVLGGKECDKERFEITVRDYGPGIPAGRLQSVFDKYERIRKQDTQVAGTGLGLAIAKAVIEAQGGEIKAGNHPDGGAVFTVYLPKWRKC